MLNNTVCVFFETLELGLVHYNGTKKLADLVDVAVSLVGVRHDHGDTNFFGVKHIDLGTLDVRNVFSIEW